LEVTDTGLQLLVAPPDDDGGSPVSGYSVEVQRVPSHKWLHHGVVAMDVTPAYVGRLRRYHAIAVNDLEARQRYRIRVSAVNDAGYTGPPTTKCCNKPENTSKDMSSGETNVLTEISL